MTDNPKAKLLFSSLLQGLSLLGVVGHGCRLQAVRQEVNEKVSEAQPTKETFFD